MSTARPSRIAIQPGALDLTRHGRQVAYAAFAALEEPDQQDLLDYLHWQRIEDAHPTT